ncbi:ABCB family ABC transporter ATP-binding protein/permease [Pinisolibacter aquiterrae]|uniref:ABCB family ABC transporter ATP-binding protein/permease n=1 Tax=Pinisolibacter aquiterrae TaxID=2815579 RepID=UPI001C3E2BB6|nr:ABC transporter ATP-binding protein/permease [Pinisolibacter aquiterrae]MBV5263051.1 ABC transporter ATP-binding protein/permease [Pinisolibacter aquiterrae]MCC8233967.1 ABC transporter ATP-binding protein/permease [Pinisolibacter aquiterrae]
MSRHHRPVGPRVSAGEGKTFETLKNLWPHLWPHDRPDLKRAVMLAFGALILGKVTTVFLPYIYKWSTDALAAPAGEPQTVQLLAVPVLLVIAYGVVRIASNGFNQLRDALFAAVGQHAVRELATSTFRHLHALSLRFHLQRRTGGLSRVVERGAKGIETIVRISILAGFPTIVEFALMAGVILWEFDWVYVAVIAVTTWLYVWFSVKASDWRMDIRRDMNEADNDSMSKAVDSLLNFETVKYFTAENLEATRYDRAMQKYEGAAIRTYTSLAWLNFGQAVIFSIGMAACMALSAHAVLKGEQSVGHFVMINALMMQLSVPLNFIGTLYREIKQSLVDIESLFAILDQPPEVSDRADAKPLRVTDAAIRFENVTFSYDPERQILKGVSFEVPAGKTVAIVGPSGAGKSTISRLLFRFYDVSGGRITIDGQDIRDVTQTSLRGVIGMVPQDTVLFNDTVAYNIRYGRPDASEAEVMEAARLAQIAEFIERLPKRYETEVGERGLKLSGGEKQRVAIARTILKAPPILMLDEATSALDTHTEREIQEALDRVSQNRTTLVIAHRLSTVVAADEILVLDKGVVAERGRHDELLAADGLYASMWARQRAADEAREQLEKTVAEDPYGVVERGAPAAE